LAQIASGNVDYSLVGNILIGSMPGVWIGAHFVDRVPDQALRVTLSAALLGSALAMVNNAGGKMPVPVIFGAPIAVGIVGFLLHLRSQRQSEEPAAKLAGRPTIAAASTGIAVSKSSLTASEGS
jgi:hypothetical protein